MSDPQACLSGQALGQVRGFPTLQSTGMMGRISVLLKWSGLRAKQLRGAWQGGRRKQHLPAACAAEKLQPSQLGGCKYHCDLQLPSLPLSSPPSQYFSPDGVYLTSKNESLVKGTSLQLPINAWWSLRQWWEAVKCCGCGIGSDHPRHRLGQP